MDEVEEEEAVEADVVAVVVMVEAVEKDAITIVTTKI